VLAAGFLGWLCAGVQMGLMPLASLSVSKDLMGATFNDVTAGDWCARYTASIMLGAAVGGIGCRSLPFCDRVVSVSRDKYLPSHNRGIPVPKEPTTIGGHLRRRRLRLKIFQPEAARRVGVSTVSLSRWECDKVFPTNPHHAKISAYLGYDPFNQALQKASEYAKATNPNSLPFCESRPGATGLKTARCVRSETGGFVAPTSSLDHHSSGNRCSPACHA
jgi:transcriptional regulator with XRE-family HTH domain